ncbi:MAG TPA: ComF family protein, partial [Gammaproteobacteria bacterium]|nr:ComF family protein [Gammaproteobacteria bacterium]
MLFRRLLATLYPPVCLLCGAAGTRGMDLCSACFAELPWNRHPCPRCAAPLPPDIDTPLCGDCIKSPPPWDEAKSPLAYAYPLDKLIQRFKFNGDLPIGRLLGELLADYLAAGGAKPELLIPVPLHPSRLRERGFNQANELARPIARRFKIKVALQVCARVRATEVQSKLDAAERRKNLRNAFVVKHPLQGKHVAVLDDVVTTGATVEALSAVLKDAGAARITVWSVARAA